MFPGTDAGGQRKGILSVSFKKRKGLKVEYRIPEPTKEPGKALVIFFKVLKGVEFDDRVWDKRHFARNMDSAKDLLEICKSFDAAKRCLEELSKKFDELGLTWTFETITKHAHDWKQRRGKGNDTKSRQRFLDALTRQRSDRAFEIKGTLNGAQMVDSLRDFGIISYEGGAEERIGDSGDGSLGGEMGEAAVEEETA